MQTSPNIPSTFSSRSSTIKADNAGAGLTHTRLTAPPEQTLSLVVNMAINITHGADFVPLIGLEGSARKCGGTAQRVLILRRYV